MGAAVGYALQQSTAVTFAVFTALALGLAAPYVALTLQPAWTRLLPRPGVWMEILKQATAVPVFGTAIWLSWVLASAYGATVLGALLCAFLLLAIAGWFLGRWPTKRWATVVAAGPVGCRCAALSVSLTLTAARALRSKMPQALKTIGGSRGVGTVVRRRRQPATRRRAAPCSSISPQAGASPARSTSGWLSISRKCKRLLPSQRRVVARRLDPARRRDHANPQRTRPQRRADLRALRRREKRAHGSCPKC